MELRGALGSYLSVLWIGTLRVATSDSPGTMLVPLLLDATMSRQHHAYVPRPSRLQQPSIALLPESSLFGSPRRLGGTLRALMPAGHDLTACKRPLIVNEDRRSPWSGSFLDPGVLAGFARVRTLSRHSPWLDSGLLGVYARVHLLS